MKDRFNADEVSEIVARGDAIFVAEEYKVCAETDRLFAALMVFQWLAGIACALLISPRAWSGSLSDVHLHVWAALVLGGIVSIVPITLAWFHPGQKATRLAIAAGQALTSSLLIHLSGGRIETHFHVFVSLAFLAFYRDWQVLLTATAVVALDHLVRGAYFPYSAFGLASVSAWRWLEHVGWVAFEDVVLLYAIRRGRREMREVSLRQAELESLNTSFETLVARRTTELRESYAELDRQRGLNVASSKLAALGEMAGGVAHEINNPLAIIHGRARRARETFKEHPAAAAAFAEIETVATRISKIVKGLRLFARDGEGDPMEPCDVASVVNDTVELCREKMKHLGIELRAGGIPTGLVVAARGVQLSQVFLNLISNAMDALEGMDAPGQRWISVSACSVGETVETRVTDSGPGIPPEVRDKVMQPFFTTKAVGKGTGLGLSVSSGIVATHGGLLYVDGACQNTCFVVSLPRHATLA